MLSNKLILLFLAVIFIIILVLSSKSLSASFRSRFGNILPVIKAVPTLTPTPTPTIKISLSPSPTPMSQFPSNQNNGSTASRIPSTGGNIFALIPLAIGAILGAKLRKKTSKG